MQKEVTLLQLNDVHGYLDLHQELFYENAELVYRTCGGYARIATLVKEIRKQSPNVLLLDCGDTFHGTYPVVHSKGEILPPLLNSLGFTAMTAHWDFAYGPQQLAKLIGRLNYPMLAANVYFKDTKQLVYAPVLIKEVGGLNIGFIGLACNIVDKSMPPSFSEGIYFTDGSSELPRYVQQLRKVDKVDIVILLSHNGFPQDVALVKQHKGVDVVLSGHTHNRLFAPFIVNETVVFQSGSHGSFLGMLKLTLGVDGVLQHEHRLMEVKAEILPDPEMQEMIATALLPYSGLQEKVGETRTALDRGLSDECTMDNFLLESVRGVVEADVYFSNGWRYGAPIQEGAIHLNDLYNIIPMDAEISTVELTGEEISELVEANLESTFSAEPLHQMGGYIKRTLGITTYFKAENPEGSRVQFIFINGEELIPERTYRAAFLTEQGVPKKYGTNRQGTGLHAIGAMEEFLKHHSPISIGLNNTFVLV